MLMKLLMTLALWACYDGIAIAQNNSTQEVCISAVSVAGRLPELRGMEYFASANNY